MLVVLATPEVEIRGFSVHFQASLGKKFSRPPSQPIKSWAPAAQLQ
jgi:hypothetical protein